MKDFIKLLAELFIYSWVFSLGVAAFHSAIKVGWKNTPGPVELVCMLWRGEINPEEKRQ